MTRDHTGGGFTVPPRGTSSRPLRSGVRVATALVAVGAASVLATPPMALADGTPRVVGLWHMDEPAGSTTMRDSSGLGLDGTIGANVSPGQPSDDGSTAYQVSQPLGMTRVLHDAALNPGGEPLTISARLRVSAQLPAGDYNVVQKGQATAAGGAYKMEIYARKGAAKFGYPVCAFNGAQGHDRVLGPQSIADGKWHQVVCHLTASHAYVTVDGRSGPQSPRDVSTVSNTVDLTFGGKPDGSHGFVGTIDEVSITIG